MDSRAAVGSICAIVEHRRARGGRRRVARIASGGSAAAERRVRNLGEARRRKAGLRDRSKRSDLPAVVCPSGVAFSSGATRVGMLLERMRLHLSTQRFLAARRGDRIWEVSCDYAALSLDRLGARLRPETFAAELFPVVGQLRASARRTRRRRARGSR